MYDEMGKKCGKKSVKLEYFRYETRARVFGQSYWLI